MTSALGPMNMSPSRAPAITRTCFGLPMLSNDKAERYSRLSMNHELRNVVRILFYIALYFYTKQLSEIFHKLTSLRNGILVLGRRQNRLLSLQIPKQYT